MAGPETVYLHTMTVLNDTSEEYKKYKKNVKYVGSVISLKSVQSAQSMKAMQNTNNVKYATKNFSKSYFLVSDRAIANSDVKFYKNSEGFFANTMNLDFIERVGFAKRVVRGNINLFKEESVSNTMMMGPNGMMGSMGPNHFVDYYYNINEFDDLKKANYKNLKIDLISNQNSMFHLQK